MVEYWSDALRNPTLQYSIIPFFLDFDLGKNFEGILLKDFQFILGAQESQAVDDGNEIVRGLARFWTNSAAGAGGFGAEKHLVDAALLDGGF